MANGRIDENGLPVYAPGDFDYVRVVDRSTGASRNALAPEVTAAARVLADELDGLVQEAERVANAAINTVETTSSNILAGLEGSVDSMVADAQAEIAAALAGLGYFPPVPFEPGIVVDSGRVAVEHDGSVYAPVIAEIPFTTTGTFNPSQWRLLQGITAADLADPDGAGLVGYGNTSVFAALNRLALPETNLLAGLTGISYGDVARVVNQRDGGYWKWRSGDVSALVGSDPYGALWRAPASAPSGAAGAWERVVENGVFDAEWVLPDAMPANAQVRLQAMISALPPGTRRLLLPRRQVNVTGTVNLSKGIEYIGGGRDAPFDGGGASGFFPITVSASGARVVNVSSGNVTGTAVQGEPGGFHVTDGLGLMESDGLAIENVSFIDCHAYNARTGIRVGYKSTPSDADPDIANIHGARDTYIENFNCDGIMRIGIETMRAHGVTIVGGNVRMAEDIFDSAGIKRGVRIVGAHNVGIHGLRIVGHNEQDNSGVSVEYALNQGNESGSTDIVLVGVRVENCRETCFRIDQSSENITISGCLGIGHDDTAVGVFLRIMSTMTAGRETKNVKVAGCQGVNLSTFVSARGRIIGLDVSDCTFISNNEPTPRFFTTSGNPNNDEIIEGRFINNRGFGNALGQGGLFRYVGMSAASSITVDDNEFTPDSTGNALTFAGSGTVRMKRRDSNRTLPSSLWGEIRPALAKGEYE